MLLTTRKRFIAISAALSAVLAIAACSGEENPSDYPNDAITMIVPYDPGASSDLLSRDYARMLGDELGVEVVVENVSGGSGTVGTSEVVNADPDGYTIGYGHNSPLAIQIHHNADLPYSSTDDYTPIGGIGHQPATLSVAADAPWQTFEEFVNAARRSPGEISIGVGSARNVKDLQLQQFQQAAGVEFNIAPFSGGGSEAVTAVLGGQADAVAVNGTSVAGQIEAGKLRPLAVFTNGAYEALDAEVISGKNYDGLTVLQDSSGIIAPAGLPEEVRATLEEAHQAVVNSDKFRALLNEGGYVIDVTSSEEYKQQLADQAEAFGEILDG